jgi:hypothetical protein
VDNKNFELALSTLSKVAESALSTNNSTDVFIALFNSINKDFKNEIIWELNRFGITDRMSEIESEHSQLVAKVSEIKTNSAGDTLVLCKDGTEVVFHAVEFEYLLERWLSLNRSINSYWLIYVYIVSTNKNLLITYNALMRLKNGLI